MYTYNKNDKSYTFSFDDIDIDKMVELNENDSIDNENKQENEDITNDSSKNTNQDNHSKNEVTEELTEHRRPPKKIEVINGGNDLDISPVTDYIEVEKPKNEKRDNIVLPEDKK